MSIENNMKRIADSLEKLVEILSAGQTINVRTSAKDAVKELQDSIAKKQLAEKPKGGQDPETVAPGSLAAVPGEATGDPEPEEPEVEEDEGPTRDDVRAALQSLQKATDVKTAKGVLKKFKVVTLGKLKESDYQTVIDTCAELADD